MRESELPTLIAILGGACRCDLLEACLTPHPVRRAQLDTGIMAERQRLMDEWEEWYKGKAEWLAWAAEGAAKLLGERAGELPFTVEEVEVEETLGKPVEEVLKA